MPAPGTSTFGNRNKGILDKGRVLRRLVLRCSLPILAINGLGANFGNASPLLMHARYILSPTFENKTRLTPNAEDNFDDTDHR